MHLDKRTDHGLGPILILSDLLIFLFHLSLSTAVPLRLLRAVCRTPPFHGTEVLGVKVDDRVTGLFEGVARSLGCPEGRVIEAQTRGARGVDRAIGASEGGDVVCQALVEDGADGLGRRERCARMAGSARRRYGQA